MRYLLLILIFLVGGCAWLNDQKSNVSACLADAACVEEASSKAKQYGDSAEDIASVSGVPWAGKVAKSAVGYGSLIVLLSTMGAALKKKKESNG